MDPGPAAPPPPGERALDDRLVLAASDVDPVFSAGQTQFSITSLRELRVYTLWDGLRGQHTERRVFLAPSGDRYYEKLVPFSTELEAPVPFETQVAIPHARTVQAVEPSEDGYAPVLDYFGVAGTWISQHSMTGRWQVQVYLDGEPSPRLTAAFDLQ